MSVSHWIGEQRAAVRAGITARATPDDCKLLASLEFDFAITALSLPVLSSATASSIRRVYGINTQLYNTTQRV